MRGLRISNMGTNLSDVICTHWASSKCITMASLNRERILHIDTLEAFHCKWYERKHPVSVFERKQQRTNWHHIIVIIIIYKQRYNKRKLATGALNIPSGIRELSIILTLAEILRLSLCKQPSK